MTLNTFNAERHKFDSQYVELRKKCQAAAERAKAASPEKQRNVQDHTEAVERALTQSLTRLDSLRDATEEEWVRARQELDLNIAIARQHLDECQESFD